MSIRPVSTTMGVSSPASVASGTGYYRYRGKQPEVKTAPREPLPQNRIATAAKRARFAEYTRRRLKGETKEEAAAGIRIKASTMHYYDREFEGSLEQIAAQSPEHAALVAEYRRRQERQP